MTKIISVVSGKGGVGKTTLVANLGVALASIGKNVLLIDGNLSGANLGLHLDILPFYPFSLNNVLKGDVPLAKSIYRHHSGVEVIPASLTDIEVNVRRLKYALRELIGRKDFIIIDSAAGMDHEVKTAVNVADSIIIVTNPELPALADAMRIKGMIMEYGKQIDGIVLNRVCGDEFELSKDYVEDYLKLPVIATIPEHKKVKEAIALKLPVVLHAPLSKPALEIRRFSHMLAEIEMPALTLKEKLKMFLGLVR